MITLRNSFHGTETRIRDRWGDSPDPCEAWERLQIEAVSARLDDDRTRARRQVRRINNALCGIAGCKCGTVRGHQ